jgi:hypothetical protein
MPGFGSVKSSGWAAPVVIVNYIYFLSSFSPTYNSMSARIELAAFARVNQIAEFAILLCDLLRVAI